jgi:hypothetical protein
MQKKQRIRYELAAASRRNAVGGARTAELNRIEHKYNLSSDGVGGTHVMGLYYSGGDYWQ